MTAGEHPGLRKCTFDCRFFNCQSDQAFSLTIRLLAWFFGQVTNGCADYFLGVEVWNVI